MISLWLLLVFLPLLVDHIQGLTVISDEKIILLQDDISVGTHAEGALKHKPLFQTRDGSEYKTTKLGSQLFHGFENNLNTMFDQVLAEHPVGDWLEQLDLDAKKISITHHMVPMRDGVRLSTYVIKPSDDEKPRSAMISRSPYGPTSDQIANIFLKLNGYVAIIQDQRGTFKSEGEFSMWHNDADDGYDTLAWIVQQPWSNGKVFSSGISADGCGTGAMILSQPPPLKGQLLMWMSLDGHETAFPGGVFREGLISGWMTLMAPNTRGVSLKKTLFDIILNEELSDWWKPIQGPGHYHQAIWPTVHITGWWDIFQGHQINMYNGIRQLSTGTDSHYLFVGPLGHCILGNKDRFLAIQETRAVVNGFHLASEVFDDIPLEKSAVRNRVRKINVFVQGSRGQGQDAEIKSGHFWSSFDKWPATKPYRLVLSSGSKLLLEPPISERKLREQKKVYTTEFAEFTYDPAYPLRTNGGNNLILMLLGMGCGSLDQQVAEARDDVVVFTSQVLNAPLPLMGQMKAVLFVSTDRPDTDFYVSVTDVHPDGSSMQIRYGLQRMRWRNSTPFKATRSRSTPGTVYRLVIDLWFTSYIVAQGHQLRVSIGSSNHPYYAKNDNTGKTPLGKLFSFPARNRIYFSSEYLSHIELPVVDLEDLPVNENF